MLSPSSRVPAINTTINNSFVFCEVTQASLFKLLNMFFQSEMSCKGGVEDMGESKGLYAERPHATKNLT